ncbi:MAG TPA: hypothetical protein VL500_02945 [Candidatus Eisenbacteria bacterium]|jgi:hypothetical protein|nr:hypothetical protein [Candidatus Eisenbacteria bacterium]
MEVTILNALEATIHVAVVRHSPQAIEFVISPERVPVPCGTVMRHDDIAPDHALVLRDLDERTNLSASFEGYTGILRAALIEGKTKDGPFWRLSLLTLTEE